MYVLLYQDDGDALLLESFQSQKKLLRQDRCEALVITEKRKLLLERAQACMGGATLPEPRDESGASTVRTGAV